MSYLMCKRVSRCLGSHYNPLAVMCCLCMFTVHKAADELIEKLNQNTILIERDDFSAEYYSGKK